MIKPKDPKITLVGAGPGDPDLLTIKGLKAIRSADVILYDALVNTQLLEETSSKSLKVFVGKRAGMHSYRQEEINILLVQYAISHGHVVRLKGGDSFVFGRGHEELAFASNYNIKVDIVPGISSCIGVPEMQSVPLTRRGLSESFWVLTGTTKEGKLSKDLAIAAQSSATIVILMGMKKLEKITEIFCCHGKENVPVMVIQNGTRKKEKTVVGTISTIIQQVKDKKIGSPGIIVIGEVVALHRKFHKTNYLQSLVEKSEFINN